MDDQNTIIVVTDVTFDEQVRQASHERPIIVDFWAPWCGPCQTLTPLITDAVNRRHGTVGLATVNVDENPRLAEEFRVRSIPNVFGFRDGKAVAQFTGVLPAVQIDRFIDDLLPTKADQLVAQARSAPLTQRATLLRDALQQDPSHREAALGLAELLWRDEPTQAFALANPHRPDPVAERILTKLRLNEAATQAEAHIAAYAANPSDGTLGVAAAKAYAANENYADAITTLLQVVEQDDSAKDSARAELVALFALLGDADPLVQQARPLLARLLH